MQTGDVKQIRALARKLRAEGERDMALRLEAAAELMEEMRGQQAQQWPAGADPVAETVWLEEPKTLTQDDLMVAAWLRAEDKGAPAFTVEDLYPDRSPERRKLTPHERWVLGPYFPVARDLEAVVLVFKTAEGVPPEVLAQLYAITYPDGNGGALVYFPRGHLSLLSRWWMAVLAHELVHGAQMRLAGGSTRHATEAMVKWGYSSSPVEVQARYYQRLVYVDLARRARDYFLSRGPMPVFP
jgi:hypothetical protein